MRCSESPGARELGAGQAACQPAAARPKTLARLALSGRVHASGAGRPGRKRHRHGSTRAARDAGAPSVTVRKPGGRLREVRTTRRSRRRRASGRRTVKPPRTRRLSLKESVDGIVRGDPSRCGPSASGHASGWHARPRWQSHTRYMDRGKDRARARVRSGAACRADRVDAKHTHGPDHAKHNSERWITRLARR